MYKKKRRVQRIGTEFFISLPKEWAAEHVVGKRHPYVHAQVRGNVVEIEEVEDGGKNNVNHQGDIPRRDRT